jgi:hypothetical protein
LNKRTSFGAIALPVLLLSDTDHENTVQENRAEALDLSRAVT